MKEVNDERGSSGVSGVDAGGVSEGLDGDIVDVVREADVSVKPVPIVHHVQQEASELDRGVASTSRNAAGGKDKP